MYSNIHEAKTNLSRLIEKVLAGEDVIIQRAGKPVARLTAYEEVRNPRQPGGWEGKIWIADDFDDPLPEEIMAAFRGEEP